MTELKTLKDILETKRQGIHIEGAVDIERLKSEAIKWVKELYLFPGPSDQVEIQIYEFMTGNKLKYSEEGKQSIINFIKYFFNLTSEDLK